MNIIGFDTETLNGLPMTLQFHDGRDCKIIYVNEKNVLDKFIAYLNSLPTKQTYVFYALNLEFDLVTLYYPKRKKLLDDRYRFTYRGWSFQGVFAKQVYSIVYDKYKNRKIYIIDISAFLRGSLKKLAELFCPDLPKLEAPDGLGEKFFDGSHAEFVSYAKRDAEICFRIGLYLDELHKRFDVSQCVSIAALAAKIFRHGFMKHAIPLPSKNVIYASLWSYHGGKNIMTVPRGYYKNLVLIDIRSAYPYAMSKFPSFSRSELYKRVIYNNPNHVPPFGVYRIEGEILKDDYPIIYSHDFKPLPKGRIAKPVWTTGFELNQALKSRYLKCSRAFGYYYDAERDDRPSPFKSYVDYFYFQKETAENKIERHFFKILLNSLYGKFIETLTLNDDDIYDLDSDRYIVAKKKIEGRGMFHPFIASLITGHCRAQLHELEIKYQSLHSATDGMFIRKKPSRLKRGLGGINIDFEGDVLFFRNKLYICYKTEKNDKPSKIFKGKYIAKYALHAFRGNVYDLERMFKNGKYEYEYIKCNKLRESERRGLQVNKFEKFKATLKLS